MRLQDGRMVQVKYPSNPYKGSVTTDSKTQDEKDWEAYLHDERSRRNDETWDPVQFQDGSSTTDHFNRSRDGDTP